MALNKSRCARFAPLQACALATITAGSFATAYAQSSEKTVKFDLPPQSLEQALKDFGVSADKQLLFATDLAEGKTVAGLSGEMEPMKALDELLDGTGLVYETTLSNVILVKIADVDEADDRDSENQNPKPVLMAQNQTRAPRSDQSPTDSSGNDSDEADEGIIPLEEIIVTGTNIRGVENPTVPVLTFDKHDIDLSGAATVDQFLRTIPQNFASQTQLTAESGNPNDVANVTQGTTVDLRGLGAGSTLTLLNGRRMTPAGISNFVDVNVLPLGVIERVDVLTDGATAIYGSDAVGGVINFVTRKDYEGFGINARYGTVTEGSMQDWGVGAAGGFNWGSGGVFAGVDYQEQTPLLATERDFVDLSLLQEGTRFGSDSERFSFTGGGNQELGPKVRFGSDLLYSDITNESNSIDSLNPRVNTSTQTALFVNTQLEYDLNERLSASLFLDYGENDVDGSDIDSAGIESVNFYRNELMLVEGRISGQLFDLPAGPVSFSIGSLYREEEYDADFNGLLISGDRSVSAGYIEALIPIIGDSDASPFIQRLDLSLAGRYEDYSDIGDSLDPKYGIYWKVSDEFSVRASYAESFRAPDLQTLNFPERYGILDFPTSFISALEVPPEFGATTLILGSLGPGVESLRPESAESFSAGFSYAPGWLSGLTVESNYFSIDYTDRVEFVAFQPLFNPVFAPLATVDPNESDVELLFDRAAAGEITLLNPSGFEASEIEIFLSQASANVSRRRVSGVDLRFAYSKDTQYGEFSVGGNGTFLDEYVGQLTPAAVEIDEVDTRYRPIDYTLRANLSWSNNGFTAFTAINYADGYRDRIDRSAANEIDSWSTIDLSLAYDTGDRFESEFLNDLRVGLNVTNLFDNDPPFVATPFGLNYDSANANPFNRQISLTLSKSF